MKTEYKYIRFVEIPALERKTKYFRCLNKKSGDILGWIEWYTSWRQYCLCTHGEIVLSAGCHDDISDFIKQLMAEHKLILAERKLLKGAHEK